MKLKVIVQLLFVAIQVLTKDSKLFKSQKFKSQEQFKSLQKNQITMSMQIGQKIKQKAQIANKMRAKLTSKLKIRNKSRFKAKLRLQFKQKAKFTQKMKNRIKEQQKSKFQKSKVDLSIFREQKMIYVLNITEENMIDDEVVSTIKANPEDLDNELRKRIEQQRELEEKGIQNLYQSDWDLRSKDFSCKQDEMIGDLYMIQKVVDLDDESGRRYVTEFRLKDIQETLMLKKVQIQMNSQKYSIKDRDGRVEEIIYLDTVYPREAEMEKEMERYPDRKRSQLEELKIKIMNATSSSDTETKRFNESGFYCFSLINDNIEVGMNDMDSLYTIYDKITQKNRFVDFITELRNQDKQNSESRKNILDNVHDHKYYQMGTFCHNSYEYIEKWVMFINREKFDCVLDFNRANHQWLTQDQSTMYLSGYTSEYQKLQKAELERQQEIDRLEREKRERVEESSMTTEQKNREELEKLTAELSELTQSMSQEQQYTSTEISSLMSGIKQMQGEVTNKGEQLQCLEQALEIRSEVENEQVIKLLKDEEMSKVKAVVSSTREKMKKTYEERIKELKEQLEKQKSSIEQEKSGYDDLMINLIRGGLKNGDKSKCVPSKDMIVNEKGDRVDGTRLEKFMTDACAEVLNDTDQDSLQSSGGTLDRLNQCTNKDTFCNICCQTQFGYDNLLLRKQCTYDCQELMNLLNHDKLTFTAALTSTIDSESKKEMKQKVEQEMMAKNQQLLSNSMRFKQKGRITRNTIRSKLKGFK